MDNVNSKIEGLSTKAKSIRLADRDDRLSAFLAIKLLLSAVPRFFDAVLARRSFSVSEEEAAKIIRLLAVSCLNMNSPDEFSNSPELEEAHLKFLQRKAESKSEVEEFVIR